MKCKTLTRLSAFLMALLTGLLSVVSCGKKNDEERETVTLTIMSWNDDFRHMMETYFIPRHAQLMENVEIRWVNDEIVGYRDNVLSRLNAGEHIDLFLGDHEMAPWFTGNSNVASLRQLSIDESELTGQYHYTRVLGTDENGVQKGSAITAEPGVLLYRADYAEQYLGITHQEEMQERLSSWESFIATAATLRENSGGKVKMLANSTELWHSVDTAMSGLWMTDGRLSVSDETAAHWLDIVKELTAADAFLGVKSFDDDWYNAIDSGVFCFYSAPWLNKSSASDNADITTIFSSAKHSGISFGKFKTSAAPNGYVFGGDWLYSSANSSHKEIVAEIIRAFTCDKEFMRLIALGNMQYVNNTDVNTELATCNIANPLLDGLDAFSVYQSAAGSLEFAAPSIYDAAVSKLLLNQTKDYAIGNATLEQTVYHFRYNVWKKFPEIADEPHKPASEQPTDSTLPPNE